MLVTDHSHGTITALSTEVALRPNSHPLHRKDPVGLDENVWLGNAVVVLPSVCIDRKAIVGANSVVTRDIPSNTVWAGIPAKQIWPTPF